MRRSKWKGFSKSISVQAPRWLTARPIAHRGLHDAQAGIVENTRSAFAAAIDHDYAIECDLQISQDGEAMVFHDATLERLTSGYGEISCASASALHDLPFRSTKDRMMTLSELCSFVSGRVPLLIEIKSHFDHDDRLVNRAAQVLRAYSGPAALMSFDPWQLSALRIIAPDRLRGIVAERRYDDPEWGTLPDADKRRMASMSHWPETQPHFVAYRVDDLPAWPALRARYLRGVPLLAWTVRRPEQLQRARRWASQSIFEGFRL
jgi:glycerophosphoryl diester phosphodiesterase